MHNKMYLILIFLPLISSIFAGLFGRFIGPKRLSIITVSLLCLTFLTSCFAFYEVALVGCPVYIKLMPWIDSEALSVDWGFLFDSLTMVMCCIVTFVSILVHFYSTKYMSHNSHLCRFISYLSLFTFFMLILVTADNFVQMFVGWEGVILCSYLLINFWFTCIQKNKAAIKAMVLNRIGDFGLVLGILSVPTIFIGLYIKNMNMIDAEFWFFDNLGVYMLILSGFGIISYIIVSTARNPVFGYLGMVYVMVLISILGFIVWAHHTDNVGFDVDTRDYFITVTKIIIIAVPIGIKIFNWLASLWKRYVDLRTPALFAIGFIFLFIVLGDSGIDVSLHDTYYVVESFRSLLSVGAVLSMLGGVYYHQLEKFISKIGELFVNKPILLANSNSCDSTEFQDSVVPKKSENVSAVLNSNSCDSREFQGALVPTESENVSTRVDPDPWASERGNGDTQVSAPITEAQQSLSVTETLNNSDFQSSDRPVLGEDEQVDADEWIYDKVDEIYHSDAYELVGDVMKIRATRDLLPVVYSVPDKNGNEVFAEDADILEEVNFALRMDAGETLFKEAVLQEVAHTGSMTDTQCEYIFSKCPPDYLRHAKSILENPDTSGENFRDILNMVILGCTSGWDFDFSAFNDILSETGAETGSDAEGREEE